MTEADLLREAIKQHRALVLKDDSETARRDADRELWMSIGAATRLRQDAELGR